MKRLSIVCAIGAVTAVSIVACSPGKTSQRAVAGSPQPGSGSSGASASPSPDHLQPRADSPIVQENRKPGTRSWRLDAYGPGDIAGFADRTSVAAGQPLRVFVRTGAARFDAHVFRLGYYQGLGGRLVTTLYGIPRTSQPGCISLSATHTITCPWHVTFSLRTGSDWVSGIYLIKLEATAGNESYVPFVVREATPAAPILFQSSVTTWQAYNSWGGRNLYYGPCASSPGGCRKDRARAVSFDRPYQWPGAPGPPEDFFGLEYPLLYFLESKGYDVAYSTDIDLEQATNGVDKRAVFISAGHDEYYSPAMRAHLTSALGSGTNLAFFGANDIFRRIRFQPSPLGPDRIEVNYKIASEDPATARDPAASTADWPSAPLAQPEQTLLGSQYTCQRVDANWVATGRPAWLFRNTGLRAGSVIPNLFEREDDSFTPSLAHPANVTMVATASLYCPDKHRRTNADSTFFVSGSGAGVFDAGSLFFDCALGPHPRGCRGYGPTPRVSPSLQQLVVNLIDAMLARRFA